MYRRDGVSGYRRGRGRMYRRDGVSAIRRCACDGEGKNAGPSTFAKKHVAQNAKDKNEGRRLRHVRRKCLDLRGYPRCCGWAQPRSGIWATRPKATADKKAGAPKMRVGCASCVFKSGQGCALLRLVCANRHLTHPSPRSRRRG
jgi:hypothetical protein